MVSGAVASRPVELFRALAVLGEPPTTEHRRVAEVLDLGEPAEGGDYAAVFVLNHHPYASVHLGPEGMMGGQARDRVAGFWRAVGRTPPAEPDHLSALLGLYAALLEEARERGAAESTMAERSAVALLHEHLAPWVPALLERVAVEAPGFYGAWARLLGETLRAELAWAGVPAQLPAHLREAPGLVDPRSGDADTFLAGLLAPVRTGMIVTRADLARVARESALGARMGDRRQTLRSILSVEPEGVFRALARHAEHARDAHGDRRGLLGPVAEFGEARAAATAGLLHALADEARFPAEGRP